MTDRLEKLEDELKRLRPLPIPRNLPARIGEELARPQKLSWSDRCLIFAMSGGAVAAFVIGALVIYQSPPTVQSPPPILATAPPAHPPETALAFAQFEGAWRKHNELQE